MTEGIRAGVVVVVVEEEEEGDVVFVCFWCGQSRATKSYSVVRKLKDFYGINTQNRSIVDCNYAFGLKRKGQNGACES